MNRLIHKTTTRKIPKFTLTQNNSAKIKEKENYDE